MFFAEGWRPVLLSSQEATGQVSANPLTNAWHDALVTAEKPFGQGRWIISQLILDGRTATNPVARDFAARLLHAS